MTIPYHAITSFPDVNDILNELIFGMRKVLGEQLFAVYLDGSLTSGDFDEDSDIDFVAVTQDEISEATFLALQDMHEKIARIDSIWAIQLEGSYISRKALRCTDLAHSLYPNIERGSGERLKLTPHTDTWDIHRYVLRERGITVFGPDPKTLIDPVFPAQLRQAMRPMLFEWAAKILDEPALMKSRGYQSYTVLTICRILYTLENGTVASKPAALRWAQESQAQRWHALIGRAWEGRHHADTEALPEDIQGTLDFIRFALEKGR